MQQRLIFGGKQMYVTSFLDTVDDTERIFQVLISLRHRNDDKTAAEYQLEGGATLHLVLALRGGN